MLTPVEADRMDWPAAVNQRMLPLLGADVAIFRLSEMRPAWVAPIADAAPARAEYRRTFRGLDPWARQMTRPGQVLVQTPERLLGSELQHTAYYRDFLLPHGIHDYIGAQIGTVPGAHAHVGVYRVGRSSGPVRRLEDSAALLAAVLPAMSSGLRAWRATRVGDADLGRVIDELREPLLLCDPAGRMLHANPASRRHLGAPYGPALRQAMEAIARDFARARTGDLPELRAATLERRFRSAGRVFRIRSVGSDGLVGPRGGVLLVLEEETPETRGRREPAEASPAVPERFGLTPREIDVAKLLARGLSNKQVAEELRVSPNTAQSHTRRVLGKLGTRSRAAVHDILCS